MLRNVAFISAGGRWSGLVEGARGAWSPDRCGRARPSPRRRLAGPCRRGLGVANRERAWRGGAWAAKLHRAERSQSRAGLGRVRIPPRARQ